MRARILLALLATLATSCAHKAVAVPIYIDHPGRPGARIEYFEEHPPGVGPWPTVVFLHGHQDAPNRIGGLAYENWGVLRQYAQKGYLAVSISLPAYGGSSGPEDFAGTFTQDAVRAVIARLLTTHAAAPDKILIEGVSLGAVTASLVAEKDARLAGLVLISGLHDFTSFFAAPKSAGARDVKAVVDQQTGGSAMALTERSALPNAARIRAKTLILNGALDDRTDADQARRFAAAIAANGTPASAHIYPHLGHAIPNAVREPEVSSFIDAALKR